MEASTVNARLAACTCTKTGRCSTPNLSPKRCRHRQTCRMRQENSSFSSMVPAMSRCSTRLYLALSATRSDGSEPAEQGRETNQQDSSEKAAFDAQKLHREVAAFGSALARSEEAAFLAAQDELRQAKERQATADAASDAVAGTAAANSTTAAFVGRASVTATAAATNSPSTGGAAAASDASGSAADISGVEVGSRKPAGTGGFNVADAVREKLARAAEYRRKQQEAESAAAEAAGSDDESSSADGPPSRNPGSYGSANEAAGFLANVMANNAAPSPNKGLRAEAFTLLKEEERKRNVEIITVDQSYAPVGDSDKGYKPKVATWGMFERPRDISKTFGGGRTLRPGQALESEEDRAARVKRLSEALSKYKRDGGFEIDPEQEAEGQWLLDLGMAAFNQGQLTAALVHFVDATAVMPLRTPVGGKARLQQAITLDSLGKSEEARAVYATLKGHPTAEVAKKANQLLGGFKAMQFLKADTISYRIKAGEYDHYFRSIRSTYNSVYYSADTGGDEDLKLPTAVATAVMLAPILLLGVKVAQKALS